MSDNTNNQLPQLKQALLALKEMRSKLEAQKYAKTEPIAIVGMGCRFPGGANNSEAFWQILRNGIDTATDIPAERWDIDAYYNADPNAEGKMYTRQGYFLSEVDKFDAQFFSITPREAVTLDPQQRLLLEVSWEALENAGQPPHKLRHTQTGVYMGVMHTDYSRRLTALGNADYLNAYYGTGNGSSFLSGRLSYFLGLQGPSMVVDTACSSSLVTVHLACQSLRLQECDLALAGGVNLILFPEANIALSRMHALAPDGRCKTFDAQADGYARGEGCGVVVLKRLSDALADGDRILALIRGSAINHDGPSSGLTVPSGTAQQQLLQQALENACIKPEQVDYVETHGTGTSLGDPIEVQALEAVYAQNRTAPLQIASVKTNIGHLESAAGIAALMKVVLSLQYQQIPPHLHLQTLNPHITLDSNSIQIPTECKSWDVEDKTRFAGVSSFGLSGINAHLILAEAPSREENPTNNQRPLQLFTISAKTQLALQQLTQRYVQHLREHPQLAIADICTSSNCGRSHFSHRLTLITESTTDLQTDLQSFISGSSEQVQTSDCTNTQTPKIAFLFTGQGSQYVNMGRELYQTQPLFRETLENCDRLLNPYLEHSLLDILYQQEELSPIHETAYTQPVLFAIEYALAQLWLSWGIQPDVVMGHSVGEYVAACIAGVFSLEDGLKLIFNRAKLMQALPRNGKMAAVFASTQQVKTIITDYQNQVAIAAINGPTNTVISGESTTIEKILKTLDTQGITYQLLQVSHAFHSPLMEPMLAEFKQIAQKITFHPPQISLVSNLTGQFVSFAEIGQAEYWCHHIREAVQFAPSLEMLYQQGYEVFLEVGPKPILTGMGRRFLPSDVLWLSSLNVGGSNWQHLLNSVSQLYLKGVEVNWDNVAADNGNKSLALPTYPFQQQKFWPQESQKVWHNQGLQKSVVDRTYHPLIGQKFYSPLSSDIHFQTTLSLEKFPELGDHQVYNAIVVPGAFYLAMFLTAAIEKFNINQQLVIEDVVFLQALILTENTERIIQIILTPAESGIFNCQLFSLDRDEANKKSWILHASSRLMLANSTIYTIEESISPVEIQARCSDYQPNSKSVYQGALTRGLYLGNSFQWLDAIWRTEGEAFSIMQSPTNLNNPEIYPLHPGIIDSCFQLLSVTLPEENRHSTSYLPIGIEKLYIQVLPLSHNQLQSYVQLRKSSSSQLLVGDIQLIDETNHTLATIQGLKLKVVNPETLKTNAVQTWQQWLYKTHWQQQYNILNSALIQPKRWLIFADTDGFATSLAEYWHQQQQICTLVYPGSEYQLTANGNYLINPHVPADFHTLIQEVITHSNEDIPWGGIVYLWGREKTFHKNITTEEIEAIQTLNCAGVLHLVQALAKVEILSPPKLWIITRNTQAIGQINSLSLEQSPLWGMGRVIALEHPEIWGGLIDLESPSTANDLNLLWSELTQNSRENLVAFCEDKRYVARLAPIEETISSPSKLPISSEGTYLITGGLGALGLQVANWLVDCGAKYLVLTTRRGATEETAEKIQLLEQKGVKVFVVKSDISQPKSVAEVLQKIYETLPPLQGIIHSAGVLNDGVIPNQNWEQFSQVLAPKLLGAWNLHNQTLDLSLDFFVLFSSAASLIGSYAQSNYAAGNAFLDALALYRQSQGLPGLSINWGPWAESGMATALSEQLQKRWQAQGIGEIQPSQGLDILAYLLTSEIGQVGVLPIKWQQFLQQFSSGSEPTFLANIAQTTGLQTQSNLPVQPAQFVQQLAAATLSQRWQLLAEYIRSQVAQVVGLSSPEEISLQQGMFDMGMDSLMSVDLKNRLQKTFNCVLPSTLTFEYPTIEALANYLAQQILGWQESSTENVDNSSPDAAEEKVLSELEELSEDTAEALLAEKLAMLEANIYE
ncbi:type I polyketide synthase [Anabaena cylindrica UHCC 0172]|uniref:type I polyketide synthase n=1 Tax=Anabaena cylindrica TaxID=1165 RepID=UPI002B20138E|nr:type I polyketide synthase [Anabaena cylindrica]MEA5550941.1 type I polyketide synthase [Anabaena cylindrica UHCC 0172]